MKTVVITGIGKGIGKALAELFLREGYRVIGTVYKSVQAPSHERLTVIPLDLALADGISACVAQIQEIAPPVDILINNAGVLIDEEETSVVIEKLRATLEVNLIGTIAFTEQLLPFVSRGGHIVNISSTAGSVELTGQGASHEPGHYPAYKISKAALNMYTATLAKRLSPGICVSSVHPGWVRTDMGGDDAEVSPEESAQGIFAYAVAPATTGGFWYRGERLPW